MRRMKRFMCMSFFMIGSVAAAEDVCSVDQEGQDSIDSMDNSFTGELRPFASAPTSTVLIDPSLSCSPSASPSVAAAVPPPAESISGKNIKGGGDDNNNVLASVLIKLLDSNGGLVATTTTDASGNYVFNDVPAGTYGVMEETAS